MRFILFVGYGNSLAESEISSRINEAQLVQPNVYSFEATDKESVISNVSRMGSSLKLAEEIPVSSDSASLSTAITQKDFSVTVIGDKNLSQKLNWELKNEHKKGRFVVAKEDSGLSPVILKKHKVDELLIDNQGKVYKTIWFHDFRHWIQKDRYMPFANARAGMLPPKIARSMVNLIPHEPIGKFLVDPFCGSGRILVEAAELGYKVAGTDTSKEQVEETLANLNFMDIQAQVLVHDATHLSEKFTDIDAIVTEPFLGKPNMRPDKVDYAVSGLEKLYLGCLKDWYKALKSGGYIVMVFPIYQGTKKEIFTSKIIDDKRFVGYNQLTRNLIYARPDAGVKREIVVLQKQF